MQYFVSVASRRLGRKENDILQKPNVTGVVLFSQNIGSYVSTGSLIKEIKSVKSELKIAVDEEGGAGFSRFAHLFPSFSQPYISTLSVQAAREHYRVKSEFLRDLGIDINLAPVVDLAPDDNSYMYKRSFGNDQGKIIELSLICLEQQRHAGVESCLKHFPGHGFTSVDSHENLPSIDQE